MILKPQPDLKHNVLLNIVPELTNPEGYHPLQFRHVAYLTADAVIFKFARGAVCFSRDSLRRSGETIYVPIDLAKLKGLL